MLDWQQIAAKDNPSKSVIEVVSFGYHVIVSEYDYLTQRRNSAGSTTYLIRLW